MPLTLMAGEDTPDDEIPEDGLEVELEVNPNVEDQLEGAASEEGIAKDADAKDKDEEETKPKAEDEPSVQDKYDAFMKANPEAREIHGKKTVKRIDKMTYETKEAERQRHEAIAFAQRTQEEVTSLKKKQTTQDGAFINEHKARLEIQLERATQDYTNAHSLNDSTGMAEATQTMGRLTAQLDNATQTETRFKRAQEVPIETEVPVYTAPQPAARQPQNAPPASPPADEKAEAWAKEHEWFGEDRE